MMKTVSGVRERFALSLRTVGSGGEALGRETYDWARGALGLTINEFYGQTECNLVLSSCAALGVSRAGAIGKPGARSPGRHRRPWTAMPARWASQARSRCGVRTR